MLTYQARALDYPAIMLGYIAYALVVVIYALWLRKSFEPRLQRFGWFLLAGQLLLLTMHGWPIGPHPWWNHDAEGNIPVAFATFQALAGSFSALAMALLAPARHRWHRGYWAFISLGLYVLAMDDFGVLHDRFHAIEDFYLVGGALLAVLSAIVWLQLAAWQRRFLILIVIGLSIGFVGAEELDKRQLICGDILEIFSYECMHPHPLEETFEKLGSFFIVMSLMGLAIKSIAAERWLRARRTLLLSFSLPTLGLLVLMTAVNVSIDWYVPMVQRGDTFRHRTDFANGYRLDASFYHFQNEYEPGSYLWLSFFGETHDIIEQDFGYAVQVVDQANGNVYAVHEHWSRKTAEQWREDGHYSEDKQKMWIPEDVPGRRALWLVFSLWEQNVAGDFVTIPITSSDQFLLSDTQIVLRELILPETTLDFSFGKSFILRDTAIPPSARVGETLVIPFTWQANADGDEDWVQFLHFVHEETGALWNHDQLPLGARLPTRLWYEGLRDTEAWQITLPADLASGNYAIYTGLYRLSDLARLPVSDVDGLPLPDARVPLGSITISD